MERNVTATTSRRRPKSRSRREVGGISQPPWRQLKNPFRPIELITADEIEAIHQASLKILSEMGIEFMSADARRVLKQAGADVDDDTGVVRFDPKMVEEAVSKAPSQFTLHARNPSHDVILGENYVVNSLVSSTPNISDLDNGRRPGTYADQCNLMRLMQSLNIVHIGGVEPVVALDLPAQSRHLDLLHAFMTFTDKAFFCRAIGREMVADANTMMAIALGLSTEEFSEQPSIFTTISMNSPRRMDAELIDGAMEMMDYGQPLLLTPFTLAGAMAPVTLAGALTQQNAEGLAMVAFSQIYRPGTPVVFGGFTSNVDMKSGAPAFGTPEYAKGVIASGQLIRRYKLPYRSSNVNAANAVDAQSAYESQMSLWACMMGGVNLVYHAAGWLEGGLTTSFEKVILDADMLQMMAEMMDPLEVSNDTMALDAMADVGIAGHFFGTQHTIERYETAFYQPLVSDWRNYETWSEAGSPTADRHANRVFKKLLEDYEQPPMATDRAEALANYVARRKKEIHPDA